VSGNQNSFPKLDAELGDDPIVVGLKRLYDSVLDEAVPDEFLSFLARIDEKAGENADPSNVAPTTLAGGEP
jgi:hypothetical protein